MKEDEDYEWKDAAVPEDALDIIFVDDAVNQAAVACEIIGDVERMLLLLVELPEGLEWARRQGWKWPNRQRRMRPRPETWLEIRSMGGATLRYVADEVMIDVKLLKHTDEVKECALQLLLREPGTVCAACIWISMFFPEEDSWCQVLLSRLCRLDRRLREDHDWVYESSMLFGEISLQLEQDMERAEKKAKEKLEAQKAKASLEKTPKAKFV